MKIYIIIKEQVIEEQGFETLISRKNVVAFFNLEDAEKYLLTKEQDYKQLNLEMKEEYDQTFNDESYPYSFRLEELNMHE